MNEAVRNTKGKLLMMAIVLATMLVALAATSKPAAAYTSDSEGRPGRVIAYQMQGTHYNPCAAMVYSCWQPYVMGNGPLVYRSPATTGTQRITVVYQLKKWNGSRWAQQRAVSHVRNLQRGYGSIRMPWAEFPLNGSKSYYRVNTYVYWENANTDRYLGGRLLRYNQRGDYVCNTQWTEHCNASGGWVWLEGIY